MFCPKCGKELIPNAKFCFGCGTPVSQPSSAAPTPPPAAPTPPSAPRPEAATAQYANVQVQTPKPQKPRRTKKKLLLIIIPVVVVIAALLVVFNFTALAARVAPGFALNRGFDKLGDALSKQSKSGPASILPTLAEYLKEGTISFSGELEEPAYGDEASFSGALYTAENGRKIMLQDLTISDSYEEIGPISFYLGSDAMAISSADLTGNSNWYGFYLDRPLSEQNSNYTYLSPEETESLQRQIDVLSDMLSGNEDPTAAAIAKDLSDVVADFLDSNKPDVSGQKVRVGASSVKATVLTYRFDERDLSALAKNLFDVLLQEDYAEYLADTYLTLDGYGSITDNDVKYFISEMEDARDEIVSALRDEIDGDLKVGFALSSNGTLIQISCAADFEDTDYGESFEANCSLSFGANPAKDGSIALVIEAEDDWDTYGISLTCTTSSNGLGGTNQTIVFSVTNDYSDGENSLVLSTDWNPSTRKFSTTFTLTEEGTVTLLLNADGALAITSGMFTLDLDAISYSEYDYWSDTLEEELRGSLQLSAKAGSSIRVPDFENFFECEALYYLF